MKERYDIFISAKTTDKDGERTKDSHIAERLYDFLSAQGLSVFFSLKALEQLGTARYYDAIDDALEVSSFLIAVGCSRDNLESKWVKKEWSSFSNSILSGTKLPPTDVYTVYEDMSLKELPWSLRDNQAFDASESGSFEKLYNYIRNAMGKEVAKGAEMTISSSSEMSVSPGVIPDSSCSPDATNYDFHVEIENTFKELFGPDKKNDNENNSSDQSVDYLGQQILDYQISKMSTEGSSGEDASKVIKEHKTGKYFMGKHFSWYNPQGVKTVIFEVQRILLHDEEEDGWIWSLLPEELEYYEELQEDEATKQTFFVKKAPEDRGNHLLLISFDSNNNCYHANMGFLDSIEVKISIRPITRYYPKHSYNTADVLADVFNWEIVETTVEERETDYTFNLKNPVFLLDPETAEMIKPTFTSRPDGLKIKGKVSLVPLKPYFAFQILRRDGNGLNYEAASESDVGMAYKDGTYGLKQNYYFARQWLEKASAMNNGQAQYELAHLYAEGKGGAVDKEKSMELLLKSAENGYVGANDAIITPSDELGLPHELLDE